MSSGRALVELSLASTRELTRNLKAFLGLTATFVFFLTLVLVLSAFDGADRSVPVVSVSGDTSSAVSEALRSAGIATSDSSSSNIELRVAADSVEATVADGADPDWISVVRVVEGIGYAPAEVVVRDTAGSVQQDRLRANLAAVLIAGVVAIAFTGTTVPLVELRRRGTLRLLGTTPVRRWQFLLGQLPVRLLLVLLETGVVSGIAMWNGYVSAGSAARMMVTFALGVIMLFAFAFLLATRSRNADLMLQLVGIVPVIVLLASGTLIPLEGAPTFVQWLSNALPSTWLMQAIATDLVGSTPFLSVSVLWAMMLGASIVIAVASARLFSWDQGEL